MGHLCRHECIRIAVNIKNWYRSFLYLLQSGSLPQ
ncbi:hypothetical protein [Tigheibacillus jepli]